MLHNIRIVDLFFLFLLGVLDCVFDELTSVFQIELISRLECQLSQVDSIWSFQRRESHVLARQIIDSWHMEIDSQELPLPFTSDGHTLH